MLWVCNDIAQYKSFKSKFQERHASLPWMDVSTAPLSELLDQCEAILAHHHSACVFLGYLEPGWMLEPTHQTRLRALFRKYPVGMACHFPKSLPFSWKNEIEVWIPLNRTHEDGSTDTLNDGSALHNKPQV
jgi:hypothetical protein